MYTDEDLDAAVADGIFTREAVSDFRNQISSLKNTPIIDEENFKLISGFNDIYVVIACLLLLISSSWMFRDFNETLAVLILPVLSWGLAEFFVLKRKMALPAIILLLSFVWGFFAIGLHIFQTLGDAAFDYAFIVASALSAVATFIHWKRFKVPIAISVGGVAVIVFIISSVIIIAPILEEWVSTMIFISGLIAFIYAMYWDASDRTRVSRHSDIAFWLHLISAPLIVYPVFSNLGILTGNTSLYGVLTILALYFFMTVVSIIVDRRAFMVSSLAYVLYALSKYLNTFGSIDYGFAITGTIIGSALLLLSAFWHPARIILLNIFPAAIKNYVPVASNKIVNLTNHST